MDYLYEAIKPTRLYIKQCPHCGLKYFGKHTGQDIEKYPGSGVYWNNHLNCHKVKPVHLWNSDWYYDTSISRFALKFSDINKIVESNNWANLKKENGLDGGWSHYNGTEKHKETSQVGAKILGKIQADNFRNGIFNKSHWWFTPEGLKFRSKMGTAKALLLHPNGIFFGKTHSEETKALIGFKSSEHQKGKGNSQYGTMWITDGTVNKKIKKDEDIPNGWYKGRKIK